MSVEHRPSKEEREQERKDAENDLRSRIYLEALYKAYFDSSAQFDRSVELISTGALLVSFAYMGDVIDYADARCKGTLLVAWVLLILTLLVALYSHAHAAKCHNTAISDIDCDEPSKKSNVAKLNRLSIVLLGAGLFFMFVYVGINF